MAKKQVLVKLDEAFLERVDREAAARGLSRTAFVVRALEAAIVEGALDAVAGRVEAEQEVRRAQVPAAPRAAVARARNVLTSAEAKAGVKPLGRS